MTYWRMQVHPAKPKEAFSYSVRSLSAGYIGLDFKVDVGDLSLQKKSELPEGAADYWAFAHEMAEDDLVLVFAHHFPVALATIDGPYNYIRKRVPELGVWFRHFRKIREARYYADRRTDVRKWEQIKMTDTISPLRDPNSMSYQVIQRW